MGSCPRQDACILFSGAMNLLEALQSSIIAFYCNSNFEKCARYKMFLQGIDAPPNLLPNDKTCVQCDVKTDN